MPRQRSPARNKAFEIYKKNNGNIKLKDIAKQLNVSDVQIRNWKNQDKWNNYVTKTKCNVTNKKNVNNNVNKKLMQQEVEEVLNNNQLTDKQKLFCIYQVKYFNATKAYQKAYESSYDVANAEGYKLLVKPCIKAEIKRLKQNKLNKAMLEPEDIFQKYMDIAFSDITDYLSFGQEEVPVMAMYGPLKDKESGKIVTKLINTVRFKESTNVDGTIINEVSQGKDGAKIKLNDRMKALEWLTEHMGMATKEQQLRCKKLETEINSINGNSDDTDNEGIKNFIEATKPTENEIKEIFKDGGNEEKEES